MSNNLRALADLADAFERDHANASGCAMDIAFQMVAAIRNLDPVDTNEVTIRISKVLEREESEGWAGIRLVTVTNHDGPDTVIDRTLCVGVSGVDDVLHDVVRDL